METQSYHQFDKHFKTMSNDSRILSEDMPVSDSRYRNIVGQLNAMFEQILRQPDKDLGADFDKLLSTMMEHIDKENGYMKLVCFPQAVQHHLHHQFICTKTAELSHRISKGEMVQPEDLGYVRVLWLFHIQMYDRAFEEYLAC